MRHVVHRERKTRYETCAQRRKVRYETCAQRKEGKI